GHERDCRTCAPAGGREVAQADGLSLGRRRHDRGHCCGGSGGGPGGGDPLAGRRGDERSVLPILTWSEQLESPECTAALTPTRRKARGTGTIGTGFIPPKPWRSVGCCGFC